MTMENLAKAARKVAQSMFCCGTGTSSDWGHSWLPPSGGWCAVDGRAVDALKVVYDCLLREHDAGSPQELHSPESPVGNIEKPFKVVQDLLDNIIQEGSGPVAPIFDEFDREEEFKRGKWYVIDEASFKRFIDFFKNFSSQDFF